MRFAAICRRLSETRDNDSVGHYSVFLRRGIFSEFCGRNNARSDESFGDGSKRLVTDFEALYLESGYRNNIVPGRIPSLLCVRRC